MPWKRCFLLIALSTGLSCVGLDAAIAAPIQIGSRSLTELEIAIAVLGVILLVVVAVRCPKGIFRRLPYSGLIILFILYVLFGWTLAIYSAFWWIWVGLISIAASLALAPSIELGMIGLRSIILAGIAALVMIFTPPNVARISKIIALSLATITAWAWAISGVKQRMETAGLERSQVIWIIAIVSWAGLWFGWLLETLLVPQLGEWVRQNIVL